MKKSKLIPLTITDYRKRFIEGRTHEQIQATYEKAWESKNFEISNYWKRATYFWAFQIASFAGYFSVIDSEEYKIHPQILYFVNCIGFVTALAWLLSNRGSKGWQRNWEQHVDLLEDNITGPLYKTIRSHNTYSVSRLNELVSGFIIGIWSILFLKYYDDKIEFNAAAKIDYQILFATLILISISVSMIFFYGRGHNKVEVLNNLKDEEMKSDNPIVFYYRVGITEN